jgi:hypothetical protein
MYTFHGVLRWIEGVGDALLSRDAYRAARMVKNRFRFHNDLPPDVMVLVRVP